MEYLSILKLVLPRGQATLLQWSWHFRNYESGLCSCLHFLIYYCCCYYCFFIFTPNVIHHLEASLVHRQQRQPPKMCDLEEDHRLTVLRYFCPSASSSSLYWNAHVFSVQENTDLKILAKNCKHNRNRHSECVTHSRKRPHTHRQFSTYAHGYFWDVFHPKRNNICHVPVDSNSTQLSTPLIPNF